MRVYTFTSARRLTNWPERPSSTFWLSCDVFYDWTLSMVSSCVVTFSVVQTDIYTYVYCVCTWKYKRTVNFVYINNFNTLGIKSCFSQIEKKKKMINVTNITIKRVVWYPKVVLLHLTLQSFRGVFTDHSNHRVPMATSLVMRINEAIFQNKVLMN